MSSLSTLLKVAVLAATTAVAGSAAQADSNTDTVTVYVYEKGFYPNIAYLDGATRVKFVNKTNYGVGLDRPDQSVLINYISSGNSVTVSAVNVINNPLRAPYLYNLGRYNSSSSFAAQTGDAPNF